MSTLEKLFTEYEEYEKILRPEREHKFQIILQLETLLDFVYKNFDTHVNAVEDRFTKERLERLCQMVKHGRDISHRGFFVTRPAIEKTAMGDIIISVENSYTLERENIILPKRLIEILNLESLELEIK